MSPENENHWHLDKKVPVSLIFAILVQTAGAFWFASDISNRVSHLEETNSVRLTGIENTRNMNRVVTERVIRLEVTLQNTNKLLEEIKHEMRKR